MKVAIVRSTLHKGSGQVTHIRELTQRLSKMGHEVFILSRKIEEGIDLDAFRINFFFDQIPFIRHIGFGVKGGFMSRSFDIIHTQYHPGIFAGNTARLLKGPRHIFTFHGFAPTWLWRNPVQKIKMIDHQIGTFIALYLGVDHVITVSKYLKNVLLRFYKFDPRRVSVIYNGVDLERFKPDAKGWRVREELGIDEAPAILFLGRLAPYKGPQFLVRAAPHILKEAPDTKFIIAGSGRYDVPRLKLLVKRLDVEEAFIFTGYIPDEKIPSLYASCDIFCYPSLWEGFGLTPAEAQASGKPVVAFNHCAIPEVVKDGETGILVPPRDHIKLAEALVELLLDEGKRRRMGEEGRRRMAKMFSWDGMAEKTVKVYEQVLQSKGVGEE